MAHKELRMLVLCRIARFRKQMIEPLKKIDSRSPFQIERAFQS